MARENEPKMQISVRLDKSDLEALKKIGEQMKPVPLNRNVMIGVAVREYVERHGKSKGKAS